MPVIFRQISVTCKRKMIARQTDAKKLVQTRCTQKPTKYRQMPAYKCKDIDGMATYGHTPAKFILSN